MREPRALRHRRRSCVRRRLHTLLTAGVELRAAGIAGECNDVGHLDTQTGSHERERPREVGLFPRAMKPRPAADVHVFTSGRPETPYHEVFLLQAEEESVYAHHDEREVFESLRVRAGILGCDGLMVLSPSHNVDSVGRATRTLRGVRATCVVYADPTKTASR